MFKRTFAAAVVTGAALITGFATAGTASADARHPSLHPEDGPNHTMSVLGNLCVAPWQWNGPVEGATSGHTTGYVACNGNSAGEMDADGHDMAVLDNQCVAPWQWNGPFEGLTALHTTDYVACNDNV